METGGRRAGDEEGNGERKREREGGRTQPVGGSEREDFEAEHPYGQLSPGMKAGEGRARCGSGDRRDGGGMNPAWLAETERASVGGGGNKHAGASVSSRPPRELVCGGLCPPFPFRRATKAPCPLDTRLIHARPRNGPSPRRARTLAWKLSRVRPTERDHAAFNRRPGLALPLKDNRLEWVDRAATRATFRQLCAGNRDRVCFVFDGFFPLRSPRLSAPPALSPR